MPNKAPPVLPRLGNCFGQAAQRRECRCHRRSHTPSATSSPSCPPRSHSFDPLPVSSTSRPTDMPSSLSCHRCGSVHRRQMPRFGLHTLTLSGFPDETVRTVQSGPQALACKRCSAAQRPAAPSRCPLPRLSTWLVLCTDGAPVPPLPSSTLPYTTGLRGRVGSSGPSRRRS